MIQGEIKQFSLYLCDFNPLRRDQTKHFVLHPCSFSLMGSTPEDLGLHLDVNVSNIKICVSPATIELTNRIMATILQQESNEVNNGNDVSDYKDLWNLRTFEDEEFWFTRAEQGFDVLSMDSLSIAASPKEEECRIKVPSIAIVIENGVGVHTIPLLFIETSMDAAVYNWTSKMEMESTVRLAMSYYNNSLALWEPFIELVEHEENGLLPWELSLSLEIDKHEDDPEKEEPTTVVKVVSDETLELLITKTCLEVFKTLSNAFSQAIDKEGLVRGRNGRCSIHFEK